MDPFIHCAFQVTTDDCQKCSYKTSCLPLCLVLTGYNLLAGNALRLVLGPADLLPPAVTVLHQGSPADVDSHIDGGLAVLDETFLDVILFTLLFLEF